MLYVDNYADGVSSIHIAANVKNIEAESLRYCTAVLPGKSPLLFGNKISHQIENHS